MDSAGVEVVRIPGSLLDSLRLASLSPPTVEFGGDQLPDFPLSRIEGGVFLPSGNVSLADGILNRVAIVSPKGELLKTFGRVGEGPGEFSGIDGLRRAPDGGLAVWDEVRGRTFLYDTTGSFTGMIQTPPMRTAQRMLPFKGFLEDGTLLFERRSLDPSVQSHEEGRYRPEFTVDQFGTDGGLVGAMASVPGAERIGQVDARGNFSAAPVVLSGSAHLAVGGGRGFVGNGRRFVIQQLSSSGLVGILEIQRPQRPASSARKRSEIRKIRQRWAQVVASGPGSAEVSVFVASDSLPFFDRLEADQDGRLWVREVPADDEECCNWMVFDSTGVPTFQVRIPEAFTFLDAQDSLVLGFMQDRFDVPTLTVQKLLFR